MRKPQGLRGWQGMRDGLVLSGSSHSLGSEKLVGEGSGSQDRGGPGLMVLCWARRLPSPITRVTFSWGKQVIRVLCFVHSFPCIWQPSQHCCSEGLPGFPRSSMSRRVSLQGLAPPLTAELRSSLLTAHLVSEGCLPCLSALVSQLSS